MRALYAGHDLVSLSVTIALNYSFLRDPASSFFLVQQCAHVDVTPVLLAWAFFPPKNDIPRLQTE